MLRGGKTPPGKPPLQSEDFPRIPWHSIQEGTGIRLPCILFPLLKKQRRTTAPTPQIVGQHEGTCVRETPGDSGKC